MGKSQGDGGATLRQAQGRLLTGRMDMARMQRAFKSVKKNRGAAGVDQDKIRQLTVRSHNLDQQTIRTLKIDPLAATVGGWDYHPPTHLSRPA
ncbi:MAG: hypothetical protein U9R05_07870 [Chloroflexota bacterium]|nr:hypothetical protein [Chloroflexota bacterium]